MKSYEFSAVSRKSSRRTRISMPPIRLSHLNSPTSTSDSAASFHSVTLSDSTDISRSVCSFGSAEPENMVFHIFLIRHGATPGNLEGRYIGRTDESLSETGRDEILRRQYPPVDIVFTSPMRRCLETASLIYSPKTGSISFDAEWCCSEQGDLTESGAARISLDLTRQVDSDARRMVRVIEEFRETDFGAFEGKNHQELDGNEDYQAWIDSLGELPFPGGESRMDVNARVIRGFRIMMKDVESYIRNAGKDISIAIISHGGTLMTMLQALFGGNYYDYLMKNGEGYSFEISHDGICSGLRARSYHRRSGELAASGALDRQSDCKTHEPFPE